MKSTLGVAVAVCVIGFGAASCGGPKSPGANPSGKDIDVVLQESGGVCTKVTHLNPEHRRKGEAINWKITNNCSKGVVVSLGDITPGTPGNTDVDPFQSYETIWVDPNDTQMLKAMIRKVVRSDTYHFSFYVNGVKQNDPDIVIDN